MSGLEIAFGIVLLVFAVGIIVIVLSQQGEQRNSGVITGGSSDTYISRNSGRTIDAFLARWTKFFAIGFFLFVIAVNIVVFCLGGNASANNTDASETETSSVSSVVEDTSSASSAEDSAASSATSSEENAAEESAVSSNAADNASSADTSAA